MNRPFLNNREGAFEFLVVSNNTALHPGFDERFEVQKIPGGLNEVYNAISKLLQNWHTLISSPLPASVMLIRSPVRSVILKRTGPRFDSQGLLVLEKARERTSVLGIFDSKRSKDDLEMIDKEQLLHSISQLVELGP